MDEMDNDELDDRGWLRVPNRKIKTTKIEREDGSVLYKHGWSFEPLVLPEDILINGQSVLNLDFVRLENSDGANIRYEEKKYRLKEVGKKKNTKRA